MVLRNLFDPELPFWRWVCNVPHMIALSFLWLVMSLPLITFVPATVALYDAIVKNMRPDIKGLYKRYFKTFKAELKRGILMSLFWLIIGAIFLAGSFVLYIISDASEIWAFCMLVYPLLYIMPVLILIWAIAIESRFVCGFWKLHQNAFAFVMNNKLKSLLILLFLIISVGACYLLPALLSVLPALATVLISIPTERALMPYYATEE